MNIILYGEFFLNVNTVTYKDTLILDSEDVLFVKIHGYSSVWHKNLIQKRNNIMFSLFFNIFAVRWANKLSRHFFIHIHLFELQFISSLTRILYKIPKNKSWTDKMSNWTKTWNFVQFDILFNLRFCPWKN